MELIQGIHALPWAGETSVTIGFFDGVHRGHQTVIGRAVEVAGERGLASACVTFDRHPLQTLSPGKVPQLLTTLRRKAELIEALGVDALFVLEFTEEVSRWRPDEFVQRVLVEGLHARHVAIGANFTFGHKAAGNLQILTELGASRGFTVEGTGLHAIDGRRVSSSSIREALVDGDLDWPRAALGRRYSVEGQVVRGAGRGRDLGFPTANLQTPPGLQLPGRGVYAGMAAVDGRSHAAAINVGVNPTFGGEPLHVEAYLLDFDEELLGRLMEVEFWERLRDEVRFEGPDQLARQMAEDVDRTRAILAGGVQGGSSTASEASR
jgi:riboflavin kinase/FMN adenylyltransferase